MEEDNVNQNMKREEIRGLFTLGLMAILVTLRLNLPYNYAITIGELKNYQVCPTIDSVLVTWGLYAFFMIFAYSSDLFSPKTCNRIKKIGQACLGASILILSLVAILVIAVNIKTSFYIGLYIAFVYLVWEIYSAHEKIYDKMKKNYNKIKKKLKG